MSSLWLVSDDGTPIEINRRRTVVGRDPSAHILLADPSVSRMHAVIVRDSGGQWLVDDRESVNGTWIDEQRIIKGPVRAGQTLRFGALVFEVSLEKPAAVPPEAPPLQVPPTQTLPAPQPPVPEPPPATPTRPPQHQEARPQEEQGMTRAEAAELLGVSPGATPQEIRQRYQAAYNDYQIRITHAPTAALRRMYQKNLQDLKSACEALAPGP